MSNLHWNSGTLEAHTPRNGALRTAADLTGILVDLARAERGFGFFDETDLRRRRLVERVHNALVGEIARTGPLGIQVEGNRFSTDGDGPEVCSSALQNLSLALERHEISQLGFERSLTATSVEALLEGLVAPPAQTDPAARLIERLRARDASGLVLNGSTLEEGVQKRSLIATPPLASACLTTSPGSPLETQGDGFSRRSAKRSGEPQAEHAGSDRRERLAARLLELEATVEDAEYQDRVSDILGWALEFDSEDDRSVVLDVIGVFADHTVGSGGRSEAQARTAEAGFRKLAAGTRLNDLIDRATDSGDDGIRAAQLLLQLGEPAIPALLDQLCAVARERSTAERGAESGASESEREGILRSLILTQGETALPGLVDAIREHDETRARIAIRLAGELQNPEALPVLLKSLNTGSLERRIETIRALSLLPGEESMKALSQALASDLEEIAAEAGRAIAASEASEALPALLAVLDSSIESHRTALGRTLIGVLGELGDQQAVPTLAALLERRPTLQRAHWHSIQLAAIDALALLPSEDSQRALMRAARHGARPVRDRAFSHLSSQSNSASPPTR